DRPAPGGGGLRLDRTGIALDEGDTGARRRTGARTGNHTMTTNDPLHPPIHPASASAGGPVATNRREITDDMDALLETLPPAIQERIRALPEAQTVIEVVMDLGRRPEARYGGGGEVVLLDRDIDEEDIQYVVDHIGSFGDDNRAGIE